MRIPDRFGLYAILTDPVLGYEYMTRLFVDHGVAFVQLRMKTGGRETVLKTAEKLLKITAGTATRLIINDDPGIAAASGADGVHIGQDDMPYSDARKTVGPDAVIGISTHSPFQVLDSCRLFPAYIGVGPVFPTPTKSKPDPAIGIEGMKKMLMLAFLPAVAIGGIDLSNLREVLEAGATNFCMVRQLMNAENPEKVLEETEKIRRDYL